MTRKVDRDISNPRQCDLYLYTYTFSFLEIFSYFFVWMKLDICILHRSPVIGISDMNSIRNTYAE